VIVKADVPLARVQARAEILTPAPPVRAERNRPPRQHRDEDVTLVDTTLEDSFPASDPPSWTASVASLAPAVASSLASVTVAQSAEYCGE